MRLFLWAGEIQRSHLVGGSRPDSPLSLSYAGKGTSIRALRLRIRVAGPMKGNQKNITHNYP
jgi:hypothetical protein